MTINKIQDWQLGFQNGFNTQEFIATEGQKVFILSNGNYAVGKNRLKVYVDYIIQTLNSSYFETSSTSFTLSDGVPAGSVVRAEWYESILPSVGGHASQHKIGGADELNVKDLVGYDSIATLANLDDIGVSITDKRFAGGADPTGTKDSTTAILAAIEYANTNGYGIHIPATKNFYKVTAPLTLYSGMKITGRGVKSKIVYSGTGNLFNLTNLSYVSFSNLNIVLESIAGTLFYLYNTFRCSWHECTVSGSHSAISGSTYYGQTGFEFRGNAGDNRVISCDLNNLGTAVKTDSIMNYFVGCTFGTNYRGIWGDAGSYSSGMSISSCTFVSQSSIASAFHILVDTIANQWWINNVWMEGSNVGIQLGKSGVGGPYSAGLFNVKIAATAICLDIQQSLFTSVNNVSLFANPSTTPIELKIDAINATEGELINVRSTQNYDLDLSNIPSTWTILGRGITRFPTIKGDVVTNGGKGSFTPTSLTDVALGAYIPSASTANMFEVKKGGSDVFIIDRFSNGIFNVSVKAGSLNLSTGVFTSATAPSNSFFVETGVLKFKDGGSVVRNVHLGQSGINSSVTSGSTSLAVTFSTAEPNNTYGVQITPAWNTTYWVTNKTASGFTVNFGTAPSGASTLDWSIRR